MGARGRVGRRARGAVAASVGATARMVVVRSRGAPRLQFKVSGGPRRSTKTGRQRKDRVRAQSTSEARGMMTTVWRPKVRIPVPEVDDEVEVGVEVPEEELLTVKGVKRKRAPYTKGPCEHGVKQRSKCKVCSACPHGHLRRARCKECGGASICEHGRQRKHCKECGGSQICEHGRRRYRCKECS